jgi:hypothetical protein
VAIAGALGSLIAMQSPAKATDDLQAVFAKVVAAAARERTVLKKTDVRIENGVVISAVAIHACIQKIDRVRLADLDLQRTTLSANADGRGQSDVVVPCKGDAACVNMEWGRFVWPLSVPCTRKTSPNTKVWDEHPEYNKMIESRRELRLPTPQIGLANEVADVFRRFGR